MPKYGALNTKKSWATSLAELRRELERWGIKDYLLPTWDKAHASRDVTVMIARGGDWQPLTCGGLPTPEQNIRAVIQVIAMARLAEARGMSLTLLQALKLKALPSGAGTPYKVLGVPEGMTDRDALMAAYRKKVQETHPDHGGQPKDFLAVMEAAKELGLMGGATG